MSIDEDGLWTKLGRGSQRQGRMYSELARLVRSRRNHSALMALSADHNRLALECRIVQLFHRDKECVHINVEDGAGESRQARGDGHERIVAASRYWFCSVSQRVTLPDSLTRPVG